MYVGGVRGRVILSLTPDEAEYIRTLAARAVENCRQTEYPESETAVYLVKNLEQTLEWARK